MAKRDFDSLMSVDVDIGKGVFLLIGFDAYGQIVLRKKPKRLALVPTFVKLPLSIVRMEARPRALMMRGNRTRSRLAPAANDCNFWGSVFDLTIRAAQCMNDCPSRYTAAQISTAEQRQIRCERAQQDFDTAELGSKQTFPARATFPFIAFDISVWWLEKSALTSWTSQGAGSYCLLKLSVRS